ncbi:HyaD/HybD family hydrogenase maturation endopeptidase [Methylacidimicrobium tartarophylax]|uniref:HyaD/HybD family hydrogenase maturation endopeptidase n=1 Tax=Methylacidimicrobium tartarophylax TaxID=1041768 RepID=UPI00115B0A3C|nr:HyaD/HybD family hydrogenase maturation endopeptidase [Methylacidimicrobium tartarophylax]
MRSGEPSTGGKATSRSPSEGKRSRVGNPDRPPSDLAVIGLGNVILRDEGLGVLATWILEANYAFSPEVRFLDGGVLGLDLVSEFERHSTLLVLDAVASLDPPGTIYRFPGEALWKREGPARTAHEVDLLDVLKVASLLGPVPNLVLLGMVPAEVGGPALGLSPLLQKPFRRYLAAILREIRHLGIRVRNKARISLPEILEAKTRNERP